MITGKPRVPDNYNEVIADGIKVYIFKEAATAPDGIKISLNGWWKFKTLQVEGIRSN